MKELIIKTNKKKEVIDITSQIEDELNGDGICNAFIKHTTAAITTADLDPGTDKDMLDAFTKMIPDLDYRHPHNPEHVPDHILATLIGPSVTVPFKNGKLQLGTWQKVVLFEFDGARDRKILLNILE